MGHCFSLKLTCNIGTPPSRAPADPLKAAAAAAAAYVVHPGPTNQPRDRGTHPSTAATALFPKPAPPADPPRSPPVLCSLYRWQGEDIISKSSSSSSSSRKGESHFVHYQQMPAVTLVKLTDCQLTAVYYWPSGRQPELLGATRSLVGAAH